MHLYKTQRGYTYSKATIQRGNTWYINYHAYNPIKGKNDQVRKTFDLNREKDLSKREKQAKLICKKINQLLPKDYPLVNKEVQLNLNEPEQNTDLEIIKLLVENNDKQGNVLEKLVKVIIDKVRQGSGPSVEKTVETIVENEKNKINIIEAINFAYKYKCNSKSKLSDASNSSRKKLLIEWIENNDYSQLDLDEFSEEHAQQYMDFWEFEEKVANNTFNNKQGFAKGIFEQLKKRKYIIANPFDNIPRKTKKKKIQDTLEPEEIKLVSRYYKQHRPWMYKALLLQFFCWIRPIELRRLKFYMFDLRKGQIKFKGRDTKNDNDDNITYEQDQPLFHQTVF